MDGWQVISLLGAAQILVAYIATQLRRMRPDSTVYNALNCLGSAFLTLVAVVGRQWGFIVLEGTWAVVSLYALLRPRRVDDA